MNFSRLLLLFLLGSSLIACASWLPDAHRIDITQGNIIKRNDLERIQVGLKKHEIMPIIGSPMLTDPFHTQRWDYIYRFIPGRGEVIQSRLTLYFEGDVLVRIDDSDYREAEPSSNKAATEPGPVVPARGPDPD